MRIRTMTGLAFAGAAVAAVVAGGVAYAADVTDPAPVVQIVTEDEGARQGAQGGTTQWSREDCPDKGGAPGGSTEPSQPSQPATPQSPAGAQEAL